MNFLDRFLDYTSESESPRSYFLWSGLTTIAAVMRDNFYQEWDYGKLYPNLFVLLVGPPALGKGTPMKLGGTLIKGAANTKVIQGSASIQAVVKTLGTYEGGGIKGASCILYSEELSSFYVKDQNTNDLLTDLWDYHETWDRNLISWNASLKNVCVNLFAASNEVLLKEVFDSRALFGGLLSRTLLVIEKRKRRKDSMISKSGKVDTGSWDELKSHLTNLTKHKGIISFSLEAQTEFNHWYHTQWDEDNPKTKTGIEGRMKTHIKKVAMILAMCETSLDLVVQKEHIEYAIELCTKLYKNYQLLSTEGGKSPIAHQAAIFLRLLGMAPEFVLSRRIIIRRNLGEFDITTLDNTVATCSAAGLIEEVSQGNEVYYRLTAKAIEDYQEIKEKKVDNQNGKV